MKKKFEMKTGFLLSRCILKLSTFEYGCLVGLHIKEKKSQRHGGNTDEQRLSDKSSFI